MYLLHNYLLCNENINTYVRKTDLFISKIMLFASPPLASGILLSFTSLLLSYSHVLKQL